MRAVTGPAVILGFTEDSALNTVIENFLLGKKEKEYKGCSSAHSTTSF
jgi:hypothetical protein